MNRLCTGPDSIGVAVGGVVVRRVFCVGMAGTGMKAIAEWFSAAGWQVSGSDRSATPEVIAQFHSRGMQLAPEHSVEHLPPLLENPKFEVKLHGIESATEAFLHGKGVIFFGGHGGCFELMPQLLAEVFGPMHGDITAIYRPARQATDDQRKKVERKKPRKIPTPPRDAICFVCSLRASGTSNNFFSEATRMMAGSTR